MKKETWWLIDSGARDPYYNMALDECLLLWHSEGRIPPVIRFYEWNPATLSIGYFQKINQEIDVDAVHRHELGLVRRPTGGRGVLHDQELTYSVIVSEEHPRMPATVTEAYRVISEGLLHGFRDLGLNAGFSIPESKEQTEALKNPRSSVCFDASSWYELVVEGVKLQEVPKRDKKELFSNTVPLRSHLMKSNYLIYSFLKMLVYVRRCNKHFERRRSESTI